MQYLRTLPPKVSLQCAYTRNPVEKHTNTSYPTPENGFHGWHRHESMKRISFLNGARRRFPLQKRRPKNHQYAQFMYSRTVVSKVLFCGVYSVQRAENNLILQPTCQRTPNDGRHQCASQKMIFFCKTLGWYP